jgi:hypothetical protein
MGPFKINANAAIQWLWGYLLMFLITTSTSQAFTASSIRMKACVLHQDASLWNGGLFGFKNNENNNDDPPLETLQLKGINPVPPPKRVLEMPVSSIKRGGLRFALGLHLIGMEQKKGTWRPNQINENVLVMEFKDNSAMFQIKFDDDAVRVDRYGTPSLQYLLQESVVLHSVLDELNTLCFDGEIVAENRLVQLKDPGDAIERARATLPARKA